MYEVFSITLNLWNQFLKMMQKYKKKPTKKKNNLFLLQREWFLDTILYPKKKKRYVEFSSSSLDLFTFWPLFPRDQEVVVEFLGFVNVKDEGRLICLFLNWPLDVNFPK